MGKNAMLTNESSQGNDVKSKSEDYKIARIDDIPIEMPSGNTSIKPMVGVYRIATVSSLKKIESISLSYDSEKERLRQIYLRANSCNNNVNSDTNN
jgi:hypothetical protein